MCCLGLKIAMKGSDCVVYLNRRAKYYTLDKFSAIVLWHSYILSCLKMFTKFHSNLISLLSTRRNIYILQLLCITPVLIYLSMCYIMLSKKVTGIIIDSTSQPIPSYTTFINILNIGDSCYYIWGISSSLMFCVTQL